MNLSVPPGFGTASLGRIRLRGQTGLAGGGGKHTEGSVGGALCGDGGQIDRDLCTACVLRATLRTDCPEKPPDCPLPPNGPQTKQGTAQMCDVVLQLPVGQINVQNQTSDRRCVHHSCYIRHCPNGQMVAR